jgi:hypothetical protein
VLQRCATDGVCTDKSEVEMRKSETPMIWCLIAGCLGRVIGRWLNRDGKGSKPLLLPLTLTLMAGSTPPTRTDEWQSRRRATVGGDSRVDDRQGMSLRLGLVSPR